jgi:hypothetical protein
MTVAAVSSTTFPARLLGNGVSTVFNVAWKILAKTDLHVYVGTALKTVDIDYTVSGFGSDAGGTVTFTTAPGNGVSVVILRARSVTRSTDYQAHGDFLESTVDPDFDNPVLLIQDLAQQLQRAFVLPESDPVSAYPDWSALLSLANRKGKYFGFFNATTGMPELYQSLGSTVISQSIIAALLNPQSPGEVTAGVLPPNMQYSDLPIVDLRRYGMSASASGATNRAAIEAALDVAAVLGGAILQAPPGTLNIDATVTIDVDNVLIRGVGRATIWKFDPAGADVLFDFDRGASSIWFCGIESCQFSSANSIAKTAVRVRDGREFYYRGIVIAQGAWAGAASIGLQTLGREMLFYRDNFVLCARPVVIDVNPNFSTIHTDFYRFENSQIGSTETLGIAIEILNGVNYSHISFVSVAFLLGKWGVKWTDTTSTINSFGLLMDQCRWEQATDAAGYCIELTSTVQQQQQIDLRACYFDNARNGLKLTKPQAVSLLNCSLGGGVGRTNFNIVFDTRSTLSLIETHVQVGSTVTLTNALLAEGSSFNAAETVIPRNVVYRYDNGAVISQFPQYRMNSLKSWSWRGTLNNGATLSTPITQALYSNAFIKISGYSATGPIHVGGAAIWTKNGVMTKVGGSANFVVVPAGVELRVQDGGSGLVIINVLGQNISLAVDIEFE